MSDRLVRWDPFRDLVSIQDELSRLFGRTFGGSEALRPSGSGAWMPSMDVYETEDKIVAKEESYHRVERRYGSFTRAITLPQTADTEKVNADFDNGVLTIEVGKAEKAKPKKIQVKAS